MGPEKWWIYGVSYGENHNLHHNSPGAAARIYVILTYPSGLPSQGLPPRLEVRPIRGWLADAPARY